MANNQFAAPVLHVRNLLHRHGFRYCDGNDDVMRQQRQLHQAREQAATLALHPNHAETDVTTLPLEAVSATTTDHHTQDLSQTLDPDADTFWSSTGSTTTESDDELVFVCQGCALARIAAIELGVYRAQFQQGYYRAPLYPPLKISIAVGGSPSHMQPVLTLVPVAVTEEPQTFLLPAHAPVGRYLRITLHGRQQMQLEDGRYYVAIRSVTAIGKPLNCLQVCDAAQSRGRCKPLSRTIRGGPPELMVLEGDTYVTPGGVPSGRRRLLSMLGMR